MQDGEVVVWHDDQITAEKCTDTHPVVSCKTLLHFIISSISTKSPGDPTYPYVGKFIANLTLAQIKTLDCGSKRQSDFRMGPPFFPGSRNDNLGQKPNSFCTPVLAYQHSRKFLTLWSAQIPRIGYCGI